MIIPFADGFSAFKLLLLSLKRRFKTHKMLIWALFLSKLSFATLCPDPASKNPMPYPWEKNPMSVDDPQYSSNTKFEQANILISSVGGIGVSCNYYYTFEEKTYHYSIWWRDGPTSKPRDSHWSKNPFGTGYYCKNPDYKQCPF